MSVKEVILANFPDCRDFIVHLGGCSETDSLYWDTKAVGKMNFEFKDDHFIFTNIANHKIYIFYDKISAVTFT